MVELHPAPALTMTPAGTGGGVQARLWPPTPIVSVLARKGGDLSSLGVADGPRQSRALDAVALGIGPGRWLFVGQPLETLAPRLRGLASCADHSDGYAVFEVGGPKARDALAKGVPLDLHPAIFTDRVAVTGIAHIGAILWQSAPDAFALAVFRSYCGSFRHWLSASAAEFGLEIA